MELSPSWEAISCSVSQEYPNILLNPKVHYRVHKSPPLIPILSEIIPVHTTPSYLSKLRFIIIPHPRQALSSALFLSHKILKIQNKITSKSKNLWRYIL
jgi:hypothetical protein